MDPRTLEIYEGEPREADHIPLTADEAEALTKLRDRLALKPTRPTEGRKHMEKQIKKLEEKTGIAK
jgi:hypothetical protein